MGQRVPRTAHYLKSSLFILVLLSASLEGHAAEPLVFAGFAFSGNYENRESLYPHSAAIAEENINGLSVLDTAFRDKITQRPTELKRISLGLGTLGVGSQLSVAFSLVRENIEFQKIEGKVWVIVVLHASVLAFDQGSQTVVASYPVRLRYTHVLDAVPTQQQIRALVRQLYLSDDLGANIFTIWLDRFAKTEIRQKYAKYLKVTEIVVEPNAAAQIIAAGEQVRAIQNQMAISLESALASVNDIPLVPNSVGEAIGSKMAARFSNGTSFMFNLPEPDFAVIFTLRDFKAKTVDAAASHQDVYRVLAGIKIVQPDLNKSYLNENIFDTLIVIRPKSANMVLNPWNQYSKTLNALVDSTSKQFSVTDENWLTSNASRGLEAKDGFSQSAKLFQSLR